MGKRFSVIARMMLHIKFLLKYQSVKNTFAKPGAMFFYEK